ncbi:UNVERIFIED_CONTAM: hypothetical protein FKN15_041048 [Acipenser sinensis]
MKMRFLGRTCLIVLSLLPAVSMQREWSSVVGSDQPLITSPGEDVILPCHITPSLSAVDMEVRWYRENFDIPVHLYEYHNDWTDDQDSDYQGRTALSRLELQEGILSLTLRNLRPSDSGVYSCYATDGAWYGQGKTELINHAFLAPPKDAFLAPPKDASLTPPKDASLTPPKDACLTPPKDACLTPPKDACLAPPKDACLAPPKDVCLAPPKDACLTPPKDASLAPPKDASLVPPKDPSLAPPKDASLAPPKDASLAPPKDASLSSLRMPGAPLHPRMPGAPHRPGLPGAPHRPGLPGAQHRSRKYSCWNPTKGSCQPRRKVRRSGDHQPQQQFRCRRSWGKSTAALLLPEVLWLEPHKRDLPALKKVGVVWIPPTPSSSFTARTAPAEGVSLGAVRVILTALPEAAKLLATLPPVNPLKSLFLAQDFEQDFWDFKGGALGNQPTISMDSTQGEQTRLVCRSEGWSPEPEVTWRDRDGNDVTSLSNTTVQRDSQGLLSVSSYIKIKQQSNVFSCLVRSKIPKPDWESKLHISSDFFPGVSGWMVAFFLTLALSIGAIPLLVIQWRRMDAHPRLTLPVDGKPVRRKRQDYKSYQRFDYRRCVLGREGFTSGRHYWELGVGENTFWRLGVSRESAPRKEEFSMTPQQGYWTVGWDGDKDEFLALTDPQTPLPLSLKPQKLGVYLDYEEGQLSFYNVETRSHIYTFTDMEFNPNEKLYPFFWTWDEKTDLVLVSPGKMNDSSFFLLVWKWILAASVDSLSLDLDTAHPRLTLPVDGKPVRRKRQDYKSYQRFDYRRCVLGREGFTSGRHYWELGVGENTFWRLGVSRESAPRKEEFSMTPQQGYWTVGWDGDKDEFIALTDPQTPLPLSLKPQKLGVYLDYEEGQLSFYNVETRSHIYTFTDMEFNPNEKLYPFFWSLEYKDLALVSPGKMNDSSFFLLVWKLILAASGTGSLYYLFARD